MSAVRVLIVDDMAQVRRDLRTTLLLAGEMSHLSLEIAGEAADGLEAVRLAEALRPDVIIMDLCMPGMDGFQATAEIKTLHPGVTILVLTVRTAKEARQAAIQAGADGFIEKGAPITDLIQQIQKQDCFAGDAGGEAEHRNRSQ
jgi:two-component system response regulator NreC